MTVRSETAAARRSNGAVPHLREQAFAGEWVANFVCKSEQLQKNPKKLPDGQMKRFHLPTCPLFIARSSCRVREGPVIARFGCIRGLDSERPYP